MDKKNSFSHFSNRDCQYYPCHTAADPNSFNCLFCYCPLYTLGEDCGGSFNYTKQGIKDCSACLIPHAEGGYVYVLQRFERITELMNKRKAD